MILIKTRRGQSRLCSHGSEGTPIHQSGVNCVLASGLKSLREVTSVWARASFAVPLMSHGCSCQIGAQRGACDGWRAPYCCIKNHLEKPLNLYPLLLTVVGHLRLTGQSFFLHLPAAAAASLSVAVETSRVCCPRRLSS